MRVILGWVRSVAVEPGNRRSVTGAGDRVIKVWDLASGAQAESDRAHLNCKRSGRLSMTRVSIFVWGGQSVSSHRTSHAIARSLILVLQMVKCWDYHSHLSGVYALSLQSTIDVLVITGLGTSARVWEWGRGRKYTSLLAIWRRSRTMSTRRASRK